ncbi:MAG: hypothetical protein E7675_05300 [Ruminococcaceae bacterium]|nr:hypothetical protein [Oscillospiraceae bacterium]
MSSLKKLFKGKRIVALLLVICSILSLIFVIKNVVNNDVYAAESHISAGGINELDVSGSYSIFPGTIKVTTNSEDSTGSDYAKYWATESFTDGGNNKAPSGTPLVFVAPELFKKTITDNTTISNGLVDLNVVRANSENSRYSVSLTEAGNKYTVYAYTGDPSIQPSITYYVIDSSSKEVGFSTATFNSINFTPEGDLGWWKAVLDFSSVDIQWTAKKVDNTIEEYTFILWKRYRNKFTYSNLTVPTAVVFNFEKANECLGPICKQGNSITVNNDESLGTLSFSDAFGNPIDKSNCDYGKIIVTPTPVAGSENSFSKFEGVSLNPIDESSYVYELKQSEVTLSAVWDKAEVLGKIVASVDGIDTQYSLSVAGSSGSHTGVERDKHDYKFTFKCDSNTNINSISYSVKYTETGAVYKNGTLDVEDGESFELSVYWNSQLVITFTTESGKTLDFTYNFNRTSESNFTPVAKIDGKEYKYIEDALCDAKSGNTIIICEDASFITNEEDINPKWKANNEGYKLDAGVNLHLIGTVTGTSPDHPHAIRKVTSGTSQLNPDDKYLEDTFTIPQEVNFDIYGTLVIAGTVSGQMASANTSGIFSMGGGANVGAHCKIQLEGTITVKSGGILSIYGYVCGDGRIIGEVGSSIYQPLSVLDFKGGSYTVSSAGKAFNISMALTPKSGEDIISPFTQYFFYGIQCNVTMYEGAYQYAYCLLNANSEDHCSTACIVGGLEKTGLITLGDGAVFDSTYDEDATAYHMPYVGKTTISIKGGASLESMDLSVEYIVPVTIQTSSLVFPIPFNYHLELLEGNFNINYGIKLMPGSQIFVGKDAVLNFNGSKIVSIYDGLLDHTITSGKTVTAGARGSLGYPSSSYLYNSGKGYSKTANLIVEGKVVLGANVKFGGIIQAKGEDAIIDITAVTNQSNLSVTTQEGLVGNKNNKDYAGATVRTLTAQVMDATTGKRTNIIVGETYQPRSNNSVLTGYTYTVYTNVDGTSESDDETLNQSLSGSWYNYEVTVKYVVNGVLTDKTETMYFCRGADVSDMLFYDSVDCTEQVTEIPANCSELFVCCDDHDFIIGENGNIYCSDPNCKVLSGTVSYDTIKNENGEVIGGIANCKLFFFGDVEADYFVIINAAKNRYLVENVTLTEKNNYTELSFVIKFAEKESFETKLPVGATIEVYADNAANNIIKLRGYQFDGTSIRFYSSILHSYFGKEIIGTGGHLPGVDKIDVSMKISYDGVEAGKEPTSGPVEIKKVYNYLYDNGANGVFAFEDAYVFSIKTNLGYFESLSLENIKVTLIETIYKTDGTSSQSKYTVGIVFKDGVISEVSGIDLGEEGTVETNPIENT